MQNIPTESRMFIHLTLSVVKTNWLFVINIITVNEWMDLFYGGYTIFMYIYLCSLTLFHLHQTVMHKRFTSFDGTHLTFNILLMFYDFYAWKMRIILIKPIWEKNHTKRLPFYHNKKLSQFRHSQILRRAGRHIARFRMNVSWNTN